MPPNLLSTPAPAPTVLVALVLLAPVLLPLLTAAIYLVAGWGPRTAWLSTGSAVVVLAAVITLAAQVSTSGSRTAAGGLLRADALSAFMLLVVAVVALVACAATPAHLRGEISAGRARTRTATQHSVLVQVFLSAMALAVLASSLGLLWVAVEATTIVTAFLVGQRRTRAAVEAAWKYVVICSTGIAMALLGTFLLNYAAGRAGTGLDWAGLTANAAGLDPGVTRIAVVLLILGFGTKAGLAPLHSWLPDAHSQAPAPVSALMSGVLLAVAFYAILRVKAIADVTLGTGFARILLAVIALASLLVAATALIAQRDYKRMLAYSSIEHMGLLALGAAIGGPLATTAVLLHMLGHGLAKSTLFLSAGHILQATGTSQIAAVRALATRAPVIAGCFAAGRARTDRIPPVQPLRERVRPRPRRFRRGPRMAHRDRFRARPRHRRHPGRAHQPDAARPLPRQLLPRRPPTRRSWRGHRDPHHDGEHRRDAGDRAHGVCGHRGQRAPWTICCIWPPTS